MVAGFAAAMHQGRSLEDCVRWAVAAGTACAATFGAGFATLAQVEGLVSEVSLEPLTL